MCDFGNMAIVDGNKFLCLDEEYRTLPYQAIRAKLSGELIVVRFSCVSGKYRSLTVRPVK